MPRTTFAAMLIAALALTVAVFPAVTDAVGRSLQDSPNASLGTGFTFQGRVVLDGVPFTGLCDLRFELRDLVTADDIGDADEIDGVPVENGLFSVVVNSANDFGPDAFDGQRRVLGVLARCPSGAGNYVPIGSPTELTPVPYASYSMDAGMLGGFPASQYPRMARTVIVPSGGTELENGARLVAAIALITDASTSNRYLILLEPGTYRTDGPVQMKQFVDIAGMPGGLSVIRPVAGQTALIAADSSNISNLGLTGTTAGPGFVFTNAGARFFTVSDVDITASGTGGAIEVDLNLNADIRFERLTISLTCTSGSGTSCVGIRGTGNAFLTIVDSSISLLGLGFPPPLTGVSGQRQVMMTGSTVVVGASANVDKVGIATTGSGQVVLVGSEVYVSGSSGSVTGLSISNGATLRQSLIHFTTSGTAGRGVTGSGSVVVDHSDIWLSGNDVIGIAGNSVIDIRGSSVVAVSDSAGSTAVSSDSLLRISHSRIGTTAQFSAPLAAPVLIVDSSALISNSSLSGGAIAGSGAGLAICAGVTDESVAFFASSCP